MLTTNFKVKVCLPDTNFFAYELETVFRDNAKTKQAATDKDFSRTFNFNEKTILSCELSVSLKETLDV